MIVTAPDAVVLLRAVSGEGTSVGAYVRSEGKGRVCYVACGHHQAVLELPPMQRLIANAARWCCAEGAP